MTWLPFELNPDMPETGEGQEEHIARKYGRTPEQAAANRGQLLSIGERAGYSFAYAGGGEPPKAIALLREVAGSIKGLPNKVAVRGHTDSLGFAPDSGRNNWSLSTERADATRKVLQASGLPYDRFQRIEGVADTNPFIQGNPADPRNRRVSITVLNQ